jgi:hypothetical protein
MDYCNLNGFVCFKVLNIPDGGGVKAEYFNTIHRRWFPMSILPQGDEIFAPSNHQDWNRATSFEGTIMDTMIVDAEIYWNYFVDFKGVIPPDEIKVRLTVFGPCGMNAREYEFDLLIDVGNTIFIHDFENFQGAPIRKLEWDESRAFLQENTQKPETGTNGWVIDYFRGQIAYLSNYGMNADPPLRFAPGVEGEYEMFLGFRGNRLECDFEFPRMTHREHVLIAENIVPAYKWWKEVRLGRYRFEFGDEIAIHKTPAQQRNRLHSFGELTYIKLIPARPKPKRRRLRPTEIVFYGEPSSHAYYGELQNLEMAESFIEEHVSLGINTLNCQMMRIGGEAIYPSKAAPPAREGASRGDDCESSTGRVELRRNLNLFEVLPGLCRKHGIKFIANAAINVCYCGSPLESEFSARHPEYHHPFFGASFLDYTREEVREFAAGCVAEMAAYDIDGLSIDHMRYLYGQTVDTIIAFHRLVRDKIGAARYAKLEVNVRIPVDNPTYYQALEILMAENLINTVTPSHQSCLYPLIGLRGYVKLADKYGKRVHGCLDGWIKTQTLISPLPRPADYKQAARHYLNQGAAALFFYQSSQILRNVFLREFVRSLTGRQ